MWGDKIVIGDVTESAYLGPWLWKAAVEKLVLLTSTLLRKHYQVLYLMVHLTVL